MVGILVEVDGRTDGRVVGLTGLAVVPLSFLSLVTFFFEDFELGFFFEGFELGFFFEGFELGALMGGLVHRSALLSTRKTAEE
jgi:hypothetical protein